MKILVMYKNIDLMYNLKDFEKDIENTFYMTNTLEDAIIILNSYNIDKALVEIDELDEINLVEYINKYFPDISVLLLTNERNDTILTTIKRGIFATIRQPYDLKKIFNKL